MHKTSSPGFLAAGFRFPIAILGSPTVWRRASGLFAFVYQDISLTVQARVTTATNAIMLIRMILDFILMYSLLLIFDS